MFKRTGSRGVRPLSHGTTWLSLAMVIALMLVLVSSVSAQGSYDLIKGTLSDDGTPWAVIAPLNLQTWNGTIILDLDGASVGGTQPLSAAVKWLLANGYAYGGTNRSPVNYDFPKAVEHLVTVRGFFIDHVGKDPTHTIAWGSSRGGFVGRMSMQLRPDIFDGGIVMAGGGAGEIAVLNSKLDSVWVLKTLVNPASPLKIVGVPNTSAGTNTENAALIDLVNLANSTPEGRARLALAAAMEQFAPWTVANSAEPAADNYDAQYAQLVTPLGPLGPNYVFANPAVVRAPIEAWAGGVVSWNNGVNNTELLARSGRSDFVKAMYAEAGLDLQADLRTLEGAPRISADPAAVGKAEQAMSYTGQTKGPIINVDDIGDPVDSPSMKIAYEQTLRRAGNEKLLRVVWVHRAGHGGQADVEKIAAFVTLINRMNTGQWGDTSPDGMNALAQKIASESSVFPAVSPLFINYQALPLLRPWDSSNWGTYQACTTRQPGASFNSCR